MKCATTCKKNTLYKSLVRPHLEYASNVWNPIRKEDIRLEGVQRRATKLLPELADLPYAQRLRALDLPSLYSSCGFCGSTLSYMSGCAPPTYIPDRFPLRTCLPISFSPQSLSGHVRLALQLKVYMCTHACLPHHS